MDTKKKQSDLTRTIFVSGLALDVDEHTLKSYMEQFGTLKSVFVVKNKATGKSKGITAVLSQPIAECFPVKAPLSSSM